MKQLTIRGVDSNLHHRLKEEAKRHGWSINRYVLAILREASGLDEGNLRATTQYDDLDHLAGTWTQPEFDEFKEELAAQRNIDEDLWH